MTELKPCLTGRDKIAAAKVTLEMSDERVRLFAEHDPGLFRAVARYALRSDEALARKVLEAAAGCQPSTAQDPNEDAYQRGRFDAVMEFRRAILALNPAEILETK